MEGGGGGGGGRHEIKLPRFIRQFHHVTLLDETSRPQQTVVFLTRHGDTLLRIVDAIDLPLRTAFQHTCMLPMFFPPPHPTVRVSSVTVVFPPPHPTSVRLGEVDKREVPLCHRRMRQVHHPQSKTSQPSFRAGIRVPELAEHSHSSIFCKSPLSRIPPYCFSHWREYSKDKMIFAANMFVAQYSYLLSSERKSKSA